MTDRTRSQAGLEKLLVFIVAITVVLVVVPTAFGFAGIDIRDTSVGGSDGAGSDGDVAEGALLVLSSFGSEINEDRTTVGVVEILVAPSGESVNLEDVTVTWNGRDRYELTPTQVGAGDASFGVETFRDGSELQSTDRAVLRFDLGSDDIEGVDRFGDRLEPGDTVTITVTTGTGAETSETMTVPDPLPPGTAVRFV